MRAAVLRFASASPDEYAVVFTPNATGALRLVGEAFPFERGRRLLLTADNHNSVNGIRELARARGARVTYAPIDPTSLRLDAETLTRELGDAPVLHCHPRSRTSPGVQHDLDWIERARDRGWRVLLDAAAFAPTNRLDLGRHRPDFVALSFYKLFGYPTGIGCLLARHDALAELRRPWFPGGTITVVSVLADDHFLAEGEAAFEDGTIDYLGLPAVEIGLRHLTAASATRARGRRRSASPRRSSRRCSGAGT